MKQNICYFLDNQKFQTRLSLIEYCENNSSKNHSSLDLFNTAEFFYKKLPDAISTKNYIDPITATKKWITELKRNNKPIVLLFSGGLDSIFALDCMIKSKCPPDYLLIYTYNPFDSDDFFCSVNMEPMHAIEYAENLISKNAELKNTTIWNIHKDKKYAERFFSDESWLRILTAQHSVETSNHWAKLHGITENQLNEFTFIRGGNFPKVTVINKNLYFYIIDVQIGQLVDKTENKCYDFVLDNPEMFNSLCVKYNEKYKKSIVDSKFFESSPSYKQDFGNKLFLPEFSQFMNDLPPQLDKRFDSLLPYLEDTTPNKKYSYCAYLNRTPIKSWLFYLQAELIKPEWFKQYKRMVTKNEKWIRKCHSYPGKLTKLIPVE